MKVSTMGMRNIDGGAAAGRKRLTLLVNWWPKKIPSRKAFSTQQIRRFGFKSYTAATETATVMNDEQNAVPEWIKYPSKTASKTVKLTRLPLLQKGVS